MPWAMVSATESFVSAPMKFMVADIAMAAAGVRARVYTVVAMALAVSWKPLISSKRVAAHRTAMR